MTSPADARVVVLRTASALPPGQLTAAAWDVLRARTVCCARADHPQRVALAEAGVEVSVLGSLDTGETPVPSADDVLAHAPLVWLADPGRYGRPGVDAELVSDLLSRAGVLEVVGSTDPPGARLLDAVAVMDRLRSPGGCPWDAEQTTDSLKRYLLEEAYEAYETIEEGDLEGLRDELGDVLLQVLFHARVAAEGNENPAWDGPAWDIDAVATNLVAKLVRRHPHVFGDGTGGTVAVSGAAEVQTNWDEIKRQERAEKGDDSAPASPVAGVPMGMPALSLASKLQSRAAKAGFGAEIGSPALASAETPAAAVAGLAADLLEDDTPPLVERIGELLFATVALARLVDVDAETALRGTARRFRDRLDEAAGG